MSLNAVLIQKAEHCRNEILGLSWDVETDEIQRNHHYDQIIAANKEVSFENIY